MGAGGAAQQPAVLPAGRCAERPLQRRLSWTTPVARAQPPCLCQPARAAYHLLALLKLNMLEEATAELAKLGGWDDPLLRRRVCCSSLRRALCLLCHAVVW